MRMTQKDQKTKPALNVQNFPLPLHQRFKALAALNGLTVRQATIEAIAMWVEARLDDGIAALPGTSPTTIDRARRERAKIRQQLPCARQPRRVGSAGAVLCPASSGR